MTKKNEANDMIISVKKICDIMLQFWWILLVCVAIMGGVIIAKGKTSIEQEEEAQSVLVVSIQAEDLVNEKYLNKFLLDGRSEYVTSQSIANEIVKLFNTEEIQKNISTKMAENGYKDYTIEDATVEVQESTRLITVSAKGNSIKKNVVLVNTIAEELVRISNDELNLPGVRILSLAESKRDKADVNKTYLTKINLALLVLGIIIGIIIIGILIVFDKHIRSREELDWCYEGKYIGTIEKKNIDNSCDRVKLCIDGVLEKENKKNVKVISIQKSHIERRLEEVFACELNVLQDVEKLKGLQKCEGVILYITRKKDTFKDLDELIYSLNNMNIPIIGYILR